MLTNLDTLSDLGTAAANAASSAASAAESTATNAVLGPLGSLPRIICIILGLLLIAGGIFGYDKTREVIVSAGSKVAEGAAVAA